MYNVTINRILRVKANVFATMFSKTML